MVTLHILDSRFCLLENTALSDPHHLLCLPPADDSAGVLHLQADERSSYVVRKYCSLQATSKDRLLKGRLDLVVLYV